MYSKARLTALIAFLGLSISVFAQGPEVTSAAIASDRNDLQQAKEHIDKAHAIIQEEGVNSVRESTLQKYYFRRGEIYGKLFRDSEGTNMEYLDEAYENLFALIEFEERVDEDDYTEDAVRLIGGLNGGLTGVAYTAIEQGNKQVAYEAFGDLYDYKRRLPDSRVDTSSLYTMMQLSLDLDSTRATTIEHLKELIDLGYKGMTWSAIVKDQQTGEESRQIFPDKETLDYYLREDLARDPEQSESLNEQLYINLITLLQGAGQEEDFNRYFEEAKAKYPNSSSLQIVQLQGLLNEQQYAEALTVLEKLLETDPTNQIYLFNAGLLYQTEMDDIETAESYYMRAIAVDSTSAAAADPLYQMGDIWIQRSNKKVEEYNSLPLSATQRQIDAVMAEKNEYLNNALNYFLQAERVNPNDCGIAKAIFTVYYKLNNAEKAREYKARYEEIGGC